MEAWERQLTGGGGGRTGVCVTLHDRGSSEGGSLDTDGRVDERGVRSVDVTLLCQNAAAVPVSYCTAVQAYIEKDGTLELEGLRVGHCEVWKVTSMKSACNFTPCNTVPLPTGNKDGGLLVLSVLIGTERERRRLAPTLSTNHITMYGNGVFWVPHTW